MALAAARATALPQRVPNSPQLRYLLAIAFGAATLIAATGVVANHVFAQPTTTKYIVTVVGPLLLAYACLSKNPLRLLVGAAVLSASWEINATFSGVKVAPTAVLLPLAAIVALATSQQRAVRATATGSVVAVAVVLLLPALAIGREQSHHVTWMLLTLVAGWLAFRVAQEPGGLRFLFSLLVVAAFLQGLVALYEHARHANLNLYSSEINQAVSAKYFFNFGANFRPSGTLPDPDALGNLLAFALPLALALGLSAARTTARLAWGLCAIVIGVGVVLSFSRMSWLGGAVGGVVMILTLPARSRVPALVAMGALLGLTVVIGLSVGGASLRERFASIENPTARTNRTARGDLEREQIWSSALATASAHPVVGTGLGRLQEHLSEHLGRSPEGLHAQSVYFQFLAESGVAGLVALLLLVGHAASGVLVGLRRERLLLAGGAGAIVAMLITWTTETAPRYTSVSVTLAFLLGAAMAQHARFRRPMVPSV